MAAKVERSRLSALGAHKLSHRHTHTHTLTALWWQSSDCHLEMTQLSCRTLIVPLALCNTLRPAIRCFISTWINNNNHINCKKRKKDGIPLTWASLLLVRVARHSAAADRPVPYRPAPPLPQGHLNRSCIAPPPRTRHPRHSVDTPSIRLPSPLPSPAAGWACQQHQSSLVLPQR